MSDALSRHDVIKLARCWAGYEPVPGKKPYSNDSCRPVGSKKKKKKPAEKSAAYLFGQHYASAKTAGMLGDIGNAIGSSVDSAGKAIGSGVSTGLDMAGQGLKTVGTEAKNFGRAYGETFNRYYNPTSEAWNQPSKDPIDAGLKWTGRAAMGTGAAAGATAAGITAAPALAPAANAVNTTARAAAPHVGRAYKAYSAASKPLTVHAAKLLPESMQAGATTLAKGTSMGLTAGTLYDSYNSASDATASGAQAVARSSGVTDQSILDEVGSRARGQMVPMAYRAIAPKWMGGDGTEAGKQIRDNLGTFARYNIGPSMLQPSSSMTNMPLGQRALTGTFSNPMAALTSAVVPPRPSAAQMWQNIPADKRQQMASNALDMTNDSDTPSALRQGMAHIFEPVGQYHAQQTQNTLAGLGSQFNSMFR